MGFVVSLNPQTCTLHPAPCTLNLKTCTLHPTPYTLKKVTLHPKHQTLNPRQEGRGGKVERLEEMADRHCLLYRAGALSFSLSHTHTLWFSVSHTPLSAVPRRCSEGS